VIACSNVANLILARSVRREGELAIRAALGATAGALRRTLLAESLVLCGAGALLGVLIARPMVAVLARYASRFSVRALDLTVDSTLLWVGVSLAIIAAVLLAFVPRLPSTDATNGFGLANGSVRITSGTNHRLRLFAVTQIAASFLLLAGSGALLATLVALQRQDTGVNMRNVLAVHVPLNYERPPAQTLPLYREALRQIGELPGVQQVAVGTIVPWREAGAFFDAQFMVEGYAKADGEDDPRASFRTVSPGFFKSLGVSMVAGRDFDASDRSDSEKVVIISDSLAKRMFPNQDAVNRTFMWTDPVMKFIGVSTGPRRVIGVVDDLDDENIVPGKKLTVYHPMEQEFGGGRLFVHASVDPYSLVTPITKIIRSIAADQPVERAATLEDVRAEVLAPNRLNTMVFGGFAMVALTIAIVGVAGVLAFSVSARMREFGVRLAIGSTPSSLLTKVLGEGAVIATAGIVTGVIGGLALLRFAGGFLGKIEVPGWTPLGGAALVLIICAVAASLMPAARASRVDVMQALRSE
jgi:predicted permease